MLKGSSGLLLKYGIIVYALILTFCNTQDATLKNRDSISDSLKEKYNGVILSECTGDISSVTLSTLLEKPVILDTLIFDAGKRGDQFYFKAMVNDKFNNNIFADLKCTKESYELYKNSGLTSFIIAAEISQLDSLNIASEFETLDDEFILYGTTNEIYLTGNCLEIIEDPLQKELLSRNFN